MLNASGSALLGFLACLAVDRLLPTGISVVLRAGLVGGYATSSAASLATVRLVEARPVAALASSLSMLIESTSTAALGLLVGLAL